MKNSNLIERLSLISGSLIIVISSFLPLFTSCKVVKDEIIAISVNGLDSFTYYFSLLFVFLVYLSGKRNTYMLTAIFALIGASLTFFWNTIGKAGFGSPCGNSPTNYLILLYLGHFLITLSSVIRIYHKKAILQENEHLKNELFG